MFAAALGATVIAGLIFFWPMLAVGYIGDDVGNSTLNGWLAYNHLSVWDAISIGITYWIDAEGRFFPVSFIYDNLFWHLFPNRGFEKAFQMAFVLTNVITFAVFVRLITRAKGLAIFAAAILFTTFQVRFWYDAILSYLVIVPFTLECMLLSAIFWMMSFQRRVWLWSTAAVAVWIIGLLTYELTYPLTIINMYLVLRYAPSRRQKVAGVSVLCGILGMMTIGDLILRHAHQYANSPYRVALASGFFRAFALQLAGAVPLDYAWFRPFGPGMPSFGTLLLRPAVLSVLAAALVCGLVAGALWTSHLATAAKRSRNGLVDCAVIGCVLWITPAAIMALSARWQLELMPGLAYIAVYIQYFGIALIGVALAAALLSLATRSQQGGRWVFVAASAMVCAFLVYATAQANAWTYAAFDPIYTSGRINIERALGAGLLANVPDGSSVIMDSSYPFNFDPSVYSPNVKYLLIMYSGKRLNGLPDATIATLCSPARPLRPCAVRSDTFRYRSVNMNSVDAWVSIAHVDAVRRVLGVPMALSDAVRVYARGQERAEAVTLGATLVSETGDGGAIYDFKHCPDVVADYLPTLPAAQVTFGTGFYGPEHDASGQFEWSMPASSWRVTNPTDYSLDITLSTQATALSATTLTATVGHDQQRIRVTPAGVSVVVHLEAPSHSTRVVSFNATGGTFAAPGDPRVLAVRLSVPTVAESPCKN